MSEAILGLAPVTGGTEVLRVEAMGEWLKEPEEVARVLDHSDPRYLSLLLDVAHYRQGGGDPAAGLRAHRERLAVVHLKDVVSPLPGATVEAKSPALQGLRQATTDSAGRVSTRSLTITIGSIPLFGQIDSLNVSVSVGIVWMSML